VFKDSGRSPIGYGTTWLDMQMYFKLLPVVVMAVVAGSNGK